MKFRPAIGRHQQDSISMLQMIWRLSIALFEYTQKDSRIEYPTLTHYLLDHHAKIRTSRKRMSGPRRLWRSSSGPTTARSKGKSFTLVEHVAIKYLLTCWSDSRREDYQSCLKERSVKRTTRMRNPFRVESSKHCILRRRRLSGHGVETLHGILQAQKSRSAERALSSVSRQGHVF